MVHRRGDDPSGRADRGGRPGCFASGAERRRRRAGRQRRDLPGRPVVALGGGRPIRRPVSVRRLPVAAGRRPDRRSERPELHPDRRRGGPPAGLPDRRDLPTAAARHPGERNQRRDHRPAVTVAVDVASSASSASTAGRAGAVRAAGLAAHVHADRTPRQRPLRGAHARRPQRAPLHPTGRAEHQLHAQHGGDRDLHDRRHRPGRPSPRPLPGAHPRRAPLHPRARTRDPQAHRRRRRQPLATARPDRAPGSPRAATSCSRPRPRTDAPANSGEPRSGSRAESHRRALRHAARRPTTGSTKPHEDQPRLPAITSNTGSGDNTPRPATTAPEANASPLDLFEIEHPREAVDVRPAGNLDQIIGGHTSRPIDLAWERAPPVRIRRSVATNTPRAPLLRSRSRSTVDSAARRRQQFRIWTEGVTTTPLAPRTRADTNAGLRTVNDLPSLHLASLGCGVGSARRTPSRPGPRSDLLPHLEAGAGGDRRRRPSLDGADDLAAVDALQVNARDAKVRVSEPRPRPSNPNCGETVAHDPTKRRNPRKHGGSEVPLPGFEPGFPP